MCVYMCVCLCTLNHVQFFSKSVEGLCVSVGFRQKPSPDPLFFFFRKAELSVPKFVTVSKMQTSMTCHPLDGVTENKENMMFCLLKITMR